MNIIKRLYQGIRFKFDSNYGYVVPLNHDAYMNLFTKPTNENRYDSERYHIGIGKYRHLAPEVRRWLNENKSYAVSSSIDLGICGWGESHIRVHIRFSSKESAVQFKLQWL